METSFKGFTIRTPIHHIAGAPFPIGRGLKIKGGKVKPVTRPCLFVCFFWVNDSSLFVLSVWAYSIRGGFSASCWHVASQYLPILN